MADAMLPESFADLEVYVTSWAHPNEHERARARLGSTMDKIREFYSTMLKRAPDALRHLDQFPLHELPEKEARLMNLCLALVEVGNAVDYYDQPQVRAGAHGYGFDHLKLTKEKLTFSPQKCTRETP